MFEMQFARWMLEVANQEYAGNVYEVMQNSEYPNAA